MSGSGTLVGNENKNWQSFLFQTKTHHHTDREKGFHKVSGCFHTSQQLTHKVLSVDLLMANSEVLCPKADAVADRTRTVYLWLSLVHSRAAIANGLTMFLVKRNLFRVDGVLLLSSSVDSSLPLDEDIRSTASSCAFCSFLLCLTLSIESSQWQREHASFFC